ncbi:MAG: hypothetical protein KDK65_00530, partial [Chlamydiia bacterium]|nr:hypothetical protein [Chlamydiia bacterium]
QTHKAKENTKYTFVYQHPFTAIENVVHPALGFALKLLGWNFSTPLAKNRKHIIIQAAKMNSPAEITDEKILHDGVIPPEAALAAKKPADVTLLGMPPVKDPETGKPLTHNARLSAPLLTLITNQINASF